MRIVKKNQQDYEYWQFYENWCHMENVPLYVQSWASFWRVNKVERLFESEPAGRSRSKAPLWAGWSSLKETDLVRVFNFPVDRFFCFNITTQMSIWKKDWKHCGNRPFWSWKAPRAPRGAARLPADQQAHGLTAEQPAVLRGKLREREMIEHFSCKLS